MIGLLAPRGRDRAALERLGCATLLALACAPPALGQPATGAPLPDGAWRVGWSAREVPAAWAAGEVRAVTVEVRNLGDTPWPDRRHASLSGGGHRAVRLGCRWSCASGGPDWAWESGPSGCRVRRADLPAPLAPGQAVTLTLDVAAPPEPSACQLELDLVQENVAWFSARGARALALPVTVTPGARAATPRRWVGALGVAALGLLALGLLVLAGLGPAALLRSRRNAAWLPLALPAVGLATLSAVGHALAGLPFGTDWSTGPTLAALGLLAGLGWHRRTGARLRPGLVAAWLAAGLGLLLSLAPLLRLGAATTLGGSIDAVAYVSGAQRLQHAGLAQVPRPRLEDPIGQLGIGMLDSGLRQGDQYFLATLASLTGLRPHRVFSVAMAAWGALLPLGVFAFARRALRARPGVAALAAAFAALHPLTHYVRWSDFFSQAAGLAAFPFAALALVEAPRERSWRGWVLAGLLVGSLATLYPVYLAALAPLALAALLLAGPLEGSALARRSLRLAAAGAAALALFPYGWVLLARAVPFTLFVAGGGLGDLRLQGSMADFAHPGVVLGLVSPLSLEAPATAPTSALLALFLAAGAALVLLGLAVTRWRARALALTLLATLAAGAAQQRFLKDFPYGYFKLLALLAPFATMLVALGLAAVWRRARPWPERRARLARGLALALALGLAAFDLWQWRLLAREFAGPRLAADRAQLELEQARAALPADEPLLWLDGRWPGRAWSLYLLGHGLNFDRDAAPGYDAAPQEQSPGLIRHALVAGGAVSPVRHAGEPWWDPGAHEVLWSNERFRLLRRRDGAVADLRFVHPRARVPLRGPLAILLEGRELRVSGEAVPGGLASQRLEWPADTLELSLAVTAPVQVSIRRDGVTDAHELEAGEHTLRFPAGPRAELAVQPSEAGAELLGVKALATPPSR